MDDDTINDAEASGAADLKWAAAERGDINAAIEMQRIELAALLRLKPTEEPEPPDPAEWWK